MALFAQILDLASSAESSPILARSELSISRRRLTLASRNVLRYASDSP